jgi:hypothetical protein
VAEQGNKIRLVLSPQAEKYVRKDAPVGVRRMAARGALPLEPVELATVLFVLHLDSDAEVKDTARKSLDELPDAVLDHVLAGDAHPAVLSYLARLHKDDEGRCEKLALNPRVDDRTLAFLAGLPHRRVVEIVSNNQQRMMHSEEIVEALGQNPLTGRAVIERILSFLGSEEKPADELPESGDVDEAAAEAALRAVLGEGMGDLARHLASDDAVEDEELAQNLFAAVQKMSVIQKIKLARMGGGEARGLLIRDRNKVVAVSAITSPKVTETEVTAYASARNISEEVLRIIANNREWTRSYQVKLALVTNPKCPLSQSMKFLNFLQEKDLKKLMRSKDVPSPVSVQARRILSKKGKI